MKKVAKLTLFLLLVTGICGAALGYVNSITAPVIAMQDEEKLLRGYEEVYPGADEYRPLGYDGPEGVIAGVVAAIKDGQVAGVLYMVEPKGYGGEIAMLVGFDAAMGKITGLKILSQGETPGLGGNCVQPWFAGRFAGKSAGRELRLVKVETSAEDEVQGITASTITSAAVLAGVNAARADFAANYGGVG
ncbi:MAG: FMN-binding protein [Clostridiales bacterium]|nr:FMN-binding protein [Clostridiales bacterium]